MISIIWPFKSRVKSDSLNTTRFLVVNGSIVDDPDTIYEQCSQYLLRYHNTESKISINTFSMLTFRHPPKIDFMSTNIKKAITVLKNTITVDLMGFLHHLWNMVVVNSHYLFKIVQPTYELWDLPIWMNWLHLGKYHDSLFFITVFPHLEPLITFHLSYESWYELSLIVYHISVCSTTKC